VKKQAPDISQTVQKTNGKLSCSTSRNRFSAFAAPFHSCVATCELTSI